MDFDLDDGKKISLGGRSRKAVSRKALLERKRKEREERQSKRQRKEGAIRIQAFFRGRRDVKQLRKQLRGTWDNHIEHVEQRLRQKEGVVPPLEMALVVREFNLFYQRNMDEKRWERLLSCLLQHCQENGGGYLSLAKSTPWMVVQIQRLSQCITWELIPALMEWLLLVTDPVYWPSGTSPALSVLVEQGMMEKLAKEENWPWTLVQRTACSSQPFAQRAAATLLALPGINVPNEEDALIIVRNASLVRPSPLASTSIPHLDPVLAHQTWQLCNAFRWTKRWPTPKLKQATLSMAARILPSLPTNFLARASGDKKEMARVQDASSSSSEEDEEEYLQQKKKMEEQGQDAVPPPAVAEQLQLLWSISGVQQVFGGLPSSLVQLQEACALFVPLVQRCPSLHKSIVRKIALDAHGLRLLWKGSKDLFCSILFCWGYAQRLLVEDDSMFFESGIPFAPREVVSIIQHLKDAVYPLFWKEMRAPFGPMSKAVPADPNSHLMRSSMALLLERLHDRDARRRFVPSSMFWQIPRLNESDFREYVCAEVEYQREHPEYQAPALALMDACPFFVGFRQRVQLFRELIARENLMPPIEFVDGRIRIRVRRNFVVEDGFAELNHLGVDLAHRVQVTFVNEEGLEEAGIDGGGVFKEFLTSLIEAAYHPSLGLFMTNQAHELYPNPHGRSIEPRALDYLEFLGRMLGKALRESILVDLPFARFFLRKLLHRFNGVSDLPSLDAELAQQLSKLQQASEEEVEAYDLNFTIARNVLGGRTQDVPLVKDGATIPVTLANRQRYIHLIAHLRLNVEMRKACAAFQRGLSDLIEPDWLHMFNEAELQVLISGDHRAVDIDDLRKNVVYAGGYFQEHPTIVWFWKCLKEMAAQDRAKFLQFVTSTKNPPLLGFKELNPKFCIHRALGEGGVTRLPTASTCVNLLKLPEYPSFVQLREKLLYAIHAAAGFEMS